MTNCTGIKEGQAAFLITGEIVIIKDIIVNSDLVLYLVLDKDGQWQFYKRKQLYLKLETLLKDLFKSTKDINIIKSVVNKLVEYQNKANTESTVDYSDQV